MLTSFLEVESQTKSRQRSAPSHDPFESAGFVNEMLLDAALVEANAAAMQASREAEHGLIEALGGRSAAAMNIRGIIHTDDDAVQSCCVICNMESSGVAPPQRPEKWAMRSYVRQRLAQVRAIRRDPTDCCFICPTLPGNETTPGHIVEPIRSFNRRPLPSWARHTRDCCQTCPSQYWIRANSVMQDPFSGDMTYAQPRLPGNSSAAAAASSSSTGGDTFGPF